MANELRIVNQTIEPNASCKLATKEITGKPAAPSQVANETINRVLTTSKDEVVAFKPT